MTFPLVIQGGMGAGVSNSLLCNKVARDPDTLAVLSGVAVYAIVARQLQIPGDRQKDILRATDQFQNREIAERFIKDYYNPEGILAGKGFKPTTMPDLNNPESVKLYSQRETLASFVQTLLAQVGHDGRIGLNVMEKLQDSLVPTIYGYLLALLVLKRRGYILVGAGIPDQVPETLNRLANNEPVEYKLRVKGLPPGQEFRMKFDPRWIVDESCPALERPDFYPIVASNALAERLKSQAPKGGINGFIIEDYTAGGHNASPRGELKLSSDGQPIYGPRDQINWSKMVDLDLPFWEAGSRCSPEALAQALSNGAAGVQVGSAYALCRESGLAEGIKQEVFALWRDGKAFVFTDPLASPSGYPFKYILLEGSLSQKERYEARQRICDLGYLRAFAWDPKKNQVVRRCSADRVDLYTSMGLGEEKETLGKMCLCNTLLSNIGLGTIRKGEQERPLVTLGEDLSFLDRLLLPDELGYSAQRVTDYLLRR